MATRPQKSDSMAENELQDALPDDQQEDSTDLALGNDWFSGPTLWSTDWTTETVVTQLKRENINLNPRFQRRNAWTNTRKSLFIESLILGLPIPQIILAEEKGRKGSFIVIDGKQRLTTLRQFLSEDDDQIFPQLKLADLEDRRDLNGMTYKRLQSDVSFRDDLNNFENQTIRTVVIRGWKDEKYLYSVFLRINTGSVQLSPQELRQALHPGDFSNFIDDFSVNSAELKSAMKLEQPDFRMRDVELVLRYFAYANFARTYGGDLKEFLDETIMHFNRSWKVARPRILAQAEQFAESLKAIREIFNERDQLRKWNGKMYEKRINRAVFDIMTYYFSDPQIRDRSIARSHHVKNGFQNLCATNREFLSALESTTKSREANKNRFTIWAAELSRVLEIDVASPMI
jgi:hypothetical protein